VSSYVSVNIVTVHEGKMDAFVSLNRDEFVPLLRQQPGFQRFELVRTEPDSGEATLWWESEAARIAATPALQPWVEENLEALIVKLENPSGPLLISARPMPSVS